MNQAFQVFIGIAALNGLSKLIERAGASRADLESILDELLKERQDFREHFGTHFGLFLKLSDVKAQDSVLQNALRNAALRGRPLLRERKRSKQYQDYR